MEFRSFDLADAGTYSNGRKFHGEALVYGHAYPLPTVDGRTVYESIERGAFTEPSVPLFREHRPELLLARQSVRLTHGERLVVDADLLDTAAATEARALVEAGELKGMSIGFGLRGPWKWANRAGEIHRSVPAGNGRLAEISLVALPAYEGTTAAVRSLVVPDDIPATVSPRDAWLRYVAAKAGKVVQ